MNSAYRYWDKILVYPRFYISIDTVVTESNADEIKRLIENTSIKKYVLSKTFLDVYPQYRGHSKVLIVDEILGDPRYNFISSLSPRTTGAWGLRLAAEHGYEFIHMCGFDGIREELIGEAIAPPDSSNKLELKIQTNPHFNPNYFFQGYQRAGDRYQVPNSNSHTINNGIKLHTHAVFEAIKDIASFARDTQILSHSFDDYSYILPKKSTLGTLNSKLPGLEKKMQSNKTIHTLIEVLKDSYSWTLDKKREFNDANSFFIGKLNTFDSGICIDAEINLCNTFDPERPLFYINNTYLDYTESKIIENNLYNAIRSGGLIEWEVSYQGNWVSFIKELPLSKGLIMQIINYENSIYLNTKSKFASDYHSLKLCLKDYFANLANTSHKRGNFSRLNNSVYLNPSISGNLLEKVNFMAGDTGCIQSLEINHNILDIKVLRIAIGMDSDFEQEVIGYICPWKSVKETQEIRQEKSFLLKAHEKNLVELRCEYKHTHRTSKCIIHSSSNKPLKLHIKNISIFMITRCGQVIKKSWTNNEHFELINNSKDALIKKSTQINSQNSRITEQRLILIEPDMVDKQGHYYRYISNLLGHSAVRDMRKILIARRDMNIKLENIPRLDIIRTYERNTWTIQTNESEFYEKTHKAFSDINIDNADHVYMYTGSIFHALQLGKIVEQLPNAPAAITCNLFWEMIKDISSEKYQKGFNQMKTKNLADTINITAPTNYVSEVVKNHSNILCKIAPHPSTGFGDNDALKNLSDLLNLSTRISNNSCAKTIFFPGVDTINKGYSYGIELANKLSKLGYKVIARPSPNCSRSSCLEYLELGVEESTFEKYLQNADLVILPYTREGFRHRTSGLIVDAMFRNVMVCVISETWLSDFVDKYGCGFSVSGVNLSEDLKTIVDNLTNVNRSVLGSYHDNLKYLQENSWATLLQQILKKQK